MTERAIEVFVAAAALVSAPPVADQGQIDQANTKIAEARHILDMERLTTPTAGGSQEQKLLREAEQSLNRADSLASERPATAAALADKVLRDLDEARLAGQIPYDPMLQWSEQVIDDSDISGLKIANQATVQAFEDLAEKLSDERFWEGL